MKRSEINSIMRSGKEFIKQRGDRMCPADRW